VKVPSRGEIKFREEPKIKIASVLVKGSYNQLDDATDFLKKYVQTHYKQAGPLHTVYLVGPAETKIPANFQTELFIPIQ
jgi:effector-binding domain-containing protein